MKTKNKILPEKEEEKTFQYRTYGKGELDRKSTRLNSSHAR